MQGAAGALESLGRTIGPVWGNGALQFLGEGAAYGSAASCCSATAALTTGTEAAAVPLARGRSFDPCDPWLAWNDW